MVAPLRPIEAWIDDAATSARHAVAIEPDRAQRPVPRVGYPERSAIERQRAALDERIVERDAEPPGKMSVAGSCLAKRPIRVARPLARSQIVGHVALGNERQRLERMGDIAIGQPEVAMPALGADRDQLAFDELCKMRAPSAA